MKTLPLLLFALSAFAQNVGTPVLVCLSASASSTAYSCSPSPLTTFVGIPVSVNWTPDVTNTTTTPTLNLGPGAKPLKDATGNPVLVGSIVANSVYVVAIETGGANIRILTGPAIVPTTLNLQQFSPLICYDSNGAHTTAFICSRNPSGGAQTRGTVILFGFSGNTNGANPTLDVEGTGGAGIVMGNSASIPAGAMSGDASGTPNYYLLVFDADNDNWIVLNQLLPGAGSNGHAACWKGASLGYCSTVPGVTGTCTCN